MLTLGVEQLQRSTLVNADTYKNIKINVINVIHVCILQFTMYMYSVYL